MAHLFVYSLMLPTFKVSLPVCILFSPSSAPEDYSIFDYVYLSIIFLSPSDVREYPIIKRKQKSGHQKESVRLKCNGENAL